jgi:hypothetical protein
LKCAKRADTVDPHGPKNDNSSSAFADGAGDRLAAGMARRSEGVASVGMIYNGHDL